MKKEKFDEKIKLLSGHGDEDFDYIISKTGETDRVFPFYFTNSIFKDFCEIMEKDEDAFKSYSNGSGGELKERNTRYGKVPPKMASVASSSRFIYLTFRDKDQRFKRIKALVGDKSLEEGDFKFEDILDIEGVANAKPNLDASYKTDKKAIYIEAKCHELFDSHSLRWRKAYFERSGEFESGVLLGELGLSETEACVLDENGKLVEFRRKENGKEQVYHELKRSAFGLQQEGRLYLDVKQFVCHLLGIAHDGFDDHELVYLYFKPEGLEGLLEDFQDEYVALERQFKAFANSPAISYFCKNKKIKLKLCYATNNSMEKDPKFKMVYSNAT